MVRYTSTFSIEAGVDPDEAWETWQRVHVPRVIEMLSEFITKYIIQRIENANQGDEPVLYGGIELWFKDWDCARAGVRKMLGHNPDAVDEFAVHVRDLRRVFILEEKVVYEKA